MGREQVEKLANNRTNLDGGSTDPPTEERRIEFREISPALEFVAWVMVALAPLLRLANGPPVTDDQAALQVIVAGFSLTVAVGLRLFNWRVPLGG